MTPTDEQDAFRCPNCGRGLKTTAGFKRHLQRHIDGLMPQVFPKGSKAWLREHGYTVSEEEA